LEEDGSILRVKDKLPQVINDAIILVSELQERFLWVNALCIMQYDERDKKSQIPHIGMIYSQAAATIVSLSGNDASRGLPGVREESRRVRQCSVTTSPWQLCAKLPELCCFTEIKMEHPWLDIPGRNSLKKIVFLLGQPSLFPMQIRLLYGRLSWRSDQTSLGLRVFQSIQPDNSKEHRLSSLGL
jgi:hypothetical protein